MNSEREASQNADPQSGGESEGDAASHPLMATYARVVNDEDVNMVDLNVNTDRMIATATNHVNHVNILGNEEAPASDNAHNSRMAPREEFDADAADNGNAMDDVNRVAAAADDAAPSPSPSSPPSPSQQQQPQPQPQQPPLVEAEDVFYGFEEEEPTFESKDMTQVLQIWETKHTQSGFDPVPALRRLVEIFEKEKEIYMRKDPDPFDERHPYRTDPSCQFGFLLKQLFRKDQFMHKLVNDYLRDNYFTRHNLQRSSLELNILACRLILVIMPGLETSAVFQSEYDNLINRIYGWAEDSIEPLQSYATGLLAAAMEVTDIAISFREMNTRLVAKMIKRLSMLNAMYKCWRDLLDWPTNVSRTSHNGGERESNATRIERVMPSWMGNSAPQSPQRADEDADQGSSNNLRVLNGGTMDNFPNTSNMSSILENSRDAFNPRIYKKMFIPLHPPTPETSQMLILRYLTSMGEYQEFLGLIFESNAMQLIFGYIENLDRNDTCLAFEALKYLASLLCHKKFALEFISHGGLELLLKVPRPSIAATGVSITLYYLAYSEDAMERICTMPKQVITELVRYALWILGRSYDSGKCHATMFFGLSFQFKVILDEFDKHDGLRKLFNVISVLKILQPFNHEHAYDPINDDVECASRQLVRHVCVALKRYMESHLFYKYNNFMRQQCPSASEYSQNVTKATKVTLEQIGEQVRTLQENTSVRAHWAPVDQILKLGGMTLLLKIIACSYEWSNGGSVFIRSETVRLALDVLSICCVTPKVFLAYCDPIEFPGNVAASGMSCILDAAAGEIVTDGNVQKSALAVLCHCVCSPIVRKEPTNLMKCFSSYKKNKHYTKYSEELVERVWETVCSNNGIIVLLSLMQIKVPITDADCIRGMACRALAGLARSERVRQIVGKLPLFASGQIQTLMRDPILQEKRAEHVLFQKYALELLERVSGKEKPITQQLNPSLSNIHKANVIAQTKIQYNEQQLYQLIYEHLESKGMTDTAQMLQKEANLPVPSTNTRNFHQSPFDYKVLPTCSSNTRNRLRSRMQDVSQSINIIGISATAAAAAPVTTTITNTNALTTITNATNLPPLSLVNTASSSSSSTAINITNTATTNATTFLPFPYIITTISSSSSTTTNTTTTTNINTITTTSINTPTAITTTTTTTTIATSTIGTSSTAMMTTAITGCNANDANLSTSIHAMDDSIPAIVTPIKLIKKSTDKSIINNMNGSLLCSSLSSATPTSSMQRSLQKQISSFPDGTAAATMQRDTGLPPQPHLDITLSTIVTEYLTNQHALCNNPMTTCPQFDLFTPHKCPDPKPNRVLGSNMNFTTRWFRAQAGYNTSRLDRRYVHSHFSPWRTIRFNDYQEIQFESCAIVPTTGLLLVGTHHGDAKAFNLNECTELFSEHCHNFIIDEIKSNRRGDLVLTTSSWRSPLSILWSIENNEFISRLRLEDDFHCEFSNLTQDKILGTQNDTAIIYDINSGNQISKFKPTIANQYTKNRATFCPTDELILSDGVLWDVRSGTEIHKFDKLNQTLSGVFHPNGLEIISNTEVWDLRTFHLLQTIPVLDQCLVKFSPMNVLYGISLENDSHSDMDESSTYDTSFKVLDAYDYSSISTIDVKRNIADLSINGCGSLIALVEKQAPYDTKQETFVKIYAIGMKKSDQQEEEDDEEPETDDDDDGSDSDTTHIFSFNENGIRLHRRRRQRRRRNLLNANDDDDDDDDDDDEGDDDDDDDDEDDDDDDDGDEDDDDDDDDDDDGGVGDGDDIVMEINDEDDMGDDESDGWITINLSEDDGDQIRRRRRRPNARNNNNNNNRSNNNNNDGQNRSGASSDMSLSSPPSDELYRSF